MKQGKSPAESERTGLNRGSDRTDSQYTERA